MYVSPLPFPTHGVPTQVMPPMQMHIQQQQPIQPQGSSYKSSRHHHSDSKLIKSSRLSSSKHYHSHKSVHNSSVDSNLIVLSNSPSNV